ncbi:hypothetical protein BGX28_004219 [Mortierella sp. GBA30]|nr:hypothetical protein BGX28_004219 [Mortierella sp. GBA30]
MNAPPSDDGQEEPALHSTGMAPSQLAFLPSLPTECLQLIVAHHDGDLTALHSLLLVNKTFFHLAVPMLYRSPFQLVRSYERDKLPWDKFKRQVKLLWLLLCSVIHHPWVRSELPPFSAEFPILRNPILGCVVHSEEHGFDLQKTESSTGTAASKSQDALSPSSSQRYLTVDYLRYYTQHDHTTLSDAFPTLFPSLICYHMDQWSTSEDMIRIRATVERALLLHHPEGIVSMAIPITRMNLFLEAVPRLIRLRRIELYDIKHEFIVEDVIEFVRKHDLLTGGTLSQHQRRSFSGGKYKEVANHNQESNLKAAAIDVKTGILDSEAAGKRCVAATAASTVHRPRSHHHYLVHLTEIKIGGSCDYGIIEKPELYKILQAMNQPKIVDMTGWRGAVLDLAQVPVQSLETLWMRLDRPLPRNCPIQTLLKQARNLKDLQICIAPAHGGLFRWAIEKRKEMNNRGKNHHLEHDKQAWHDHTGEEEQEEQGLRNLSLAGETAATVWALIGATEAFSTTLEVLKASSWKRPFGIPLDDAELDEQTEFAEELLHPTGLQQYLNAAEENTQATLDTQSHQHHPHYDHDHSFMPASPRLSWAHVMTRLYHLELKGEVAAVAFDFRSLAQCPHLRILKLNTHPCGMAPDPSSIGLLLKHAASSLQELELVGPWIITDWHLSEMATHIFPDLRRLRLVHCRTFVSLATNHEPPTSIMSIPRHLADTMPLQQDIGPMSLTSRTESTTSSPPSFSPAFPSEVFLSTAGLIHAVEQMKELREIRLGLDMDRRHYHRRQNDRQSSSSPLEELIQANSSLAGDKTIRSVKKELSCEGEIEWVTASRALKHLSENRVLPLQIEIQYCSL